MEFFEVGRIINTHGLKGEVKIESYSSLDRFNKGNKVYIENKEYTIKSNRKDKGFEYVVFEKYEDINLILFMKGKSVFIDKSKLEDLEEDEYYYHDLIGLPVYNEDNKLLGKVKDIREVPQGELLVVEKLDSKKTGLIPFRKEFVVSVTKESIIIHEIEGLI